MEEIRHAKDNNLNYLLTVLFQSFVKLSELLRNSAGGGKVLDSKNVFGDIQLDTDVECDKIIFNDLKETNLVAYALSEEEPKLNPINGDDKEFIVSFDPLDGSSIVGCNWTVGSIFGVWKNDERKLIGHKVKDQITAGAVLYGPRLSIVYYNTNIDQVEELTYIKGRWIVSRENISIKPAGNIFAPGNLRASQDHPQYKECIEKWINEGYTLRYTGGMVPDIYQIFIKKQGVFSNLGSQKHPAKLRLLYEIGPLSFLVCKAGGMASTGESDMMEFEVTGYDQKLGIIVGSKDEVQKVLDTI